MKKIIMLIAILGMLALSACSTMPTTSLPDGEIIPIEKCTYTDGNISIEGCRIIEDYLDYESMKEDLKYEISRHNFKWDCEIYYDNDDDTMELSCEDW